MYAGAFAYRDYREKAAPPGLVSFGVTVGETDLWIAADRDLTKEAVRSIQVHRSDIEEYIQHHPRFIETLEPWEEPASRGSLPARMIDAAAAVDLGPMAAVAGALAHAVAEDLSKFSSRILVENGGDLFLVGEEPNTVGLWAGPSPLSGRLGLVLNPGSGTAVCTSSGTVGPSLSFGKADCATVIAPSGALADAAATALGNRVKTPGDIEGALDWALSVKGITGAVVILGDALGAKGDVKLVKVTDSK